MYVFLFSRDIRDVGGPDVANSIKNVLFLIIIEIYDEYFFRKQSNGLHICRTCVVHAIRILRGDTLGKQSGACDRFVLDRDPDSDRYQTYSCPN